MTHPANSDKKEIFEAFNKIVTLSRDLNNQLPIPEVVVIGEAGHGKTSVMEVLLGVSFNMTSTKRPIHLALINNAECEQPRVTLKRDSALKQFNRDKQVALSELSSNLEERNQTSWVPIYINYEYKHCVSMTFIDTPAFSADVEEKIIDIAKPANRILVFAETVLDGNQPNAPSLAKKIDPKLDRSVFVFTKFSDQMRGFAAARDLNNYLTKTATPDSQANFFISMSPEKKFMNYDEFAEDQKETQQHDFEVLEQLQFDRRFEPNIGSQALRKHVLTSVWKKYQDSIPSLLKRLRVIKKNSQDSLLEIQESIKNLDTNKLRNTAMRYVVVFLQSIEKLINGTLEGNPAQNGQTSEEERLQDEVGDWLDQDHKSIPIDYQGWNIPNFNSKLYGGQQFERVLSEFRAVVEHTKLESPQNSEIATAVGPHKLDNLNNCAWAASDIVQRNINKVVFPMLDQLFNRCVYILKRLVLVAESMIDSARKSQKRGTVRGNQGPDDMTDFPFFVSTVHELYFKFIDQIVEKCRGKCEDEFYSTRLIYWELTNLSQKQLPKNESENQRVITGLASDLFESTKDRISKNVLLKCFNFLLVPMQNDLRGEIQAAITCLSDQELQELFEVTTSKQRFVEQEEYMKTVLKQHEEQEKNFMKYSSQLSRINW